MSLIKKSNELVIPTTVKMMIYGQAGMGKSTVALSAPKPLLLDFDNGVKRMNMAHLENIDTVQVTSWSDVQQVLQEDLSAYQTIVVDTIGKMMDFIKAGDDANTAFEKAQGQYGRVADAVKFVDPRKNKEQEETTHGII